MLSYEEYTPYGSTSYYIASVPKRYRYTGKERDKETGLYYYGARYYSTTNFRWINCDPIGIGDGVNLYLYVHCNPINLNDPEGTNGTRQRGGSDFSYIAKTRPRTHTSDGNPVTKGASPVNLLQDYLFGSRAAAVRGNLVEMVTWNVNVNMHVTSSGAVQLGLNVIGANFPVTFPDRGLSSAARRIAAKAIRMHYAEHNLTLARDRGLKSVTRVEVR
jgi:RHS repeat-associated protein